MIDIQDALISSVYALELPEHFTLIELEVGERAVVAQIGWQLRQQVPRRLDDGWDVDVEYDRQLDNGDLKARRADKLAIPDLVVHRRGVTGRQGNLLVAEFKRTHRPQRPDSCDHRKVEELMTIHGYQFGAVVTLGRRLGEFSPRLWWRTADRRWSQVLVP